jgi:hypothetical protein
VIRVPNAGLGRAGGHAAVAISAHALAPVASGLEPLPGNIDDRSRAAPVVVPPGGRQAAWVDFSDLPDESGGTYRARVALAVPVEGAGDAGAPELVLADPARASPRWRPRPRR